MPARIENIADFDIKEWLNCDLVFGAYKRKYNFNLRTFAYLRLTEDTRIHGSTHQNEWRWKVVDNNLTFFHRVGEKTTSFNSVQQMGDLTVLLGPYHIDPRNTHFLYHSTPLYKSDKRVLFTVASCVGYEEALDKVLKQLIGFGINPADIWVTIANSPITEVNIKDGITISRVKENAYEYTALMDLSRRDLPFDYAYLLHDTLSLGPNFLNLLNMQSVSLPFDTMSVATEGKCNIGLYSMKFLKRINSFLEKLDGVPRIKGIEIENNQNNMGLKDASEITTTFANSDFIRGGNIAPYKSGAVREIVGFPSADIEKYFYRFFGTSPIPGLRKGDFTHPTVP